MKRCCFKTDCEAILKVLMTDNPWSDRTKFVAVALMQKVTENWCQFFFFNYHKKSTNKMKFKQEFKHCGTKMLRTRFQKQN